jgi:RNA 3'-terminal phosphate cyclase (ATP)
MIIIDGSEHSGSGTIVRYAVALAALLREPVKIVNVRQSRTKPGLRPQPRVERAGVRVAAVARARVAGGTVTARNPGRCHSRCKLGRVLN